MTKQMSINSDELAELIQDEPGIYVELLTDDPDGLYIEWDVTGGYDKLWIYWDNEQNYIVDGYHADTPFGKRHDLGTGDRLVVDKILDIVLNDNS